MGNCFGGGSAEKQPLIKKIGGHAKDEGGGFFEEDIEGEAWTDVPKRSCVVLPGSTYECPWDVIFWRFALFIASGLLVFWSIYEHVHGVNDDNMDVPIKNTAIQFWFIYLTHWGLMCEALYFLLALVTLLAAVYAQEPERKRMENPKPWYMSLTFGLQSIMLPFSFLVAGLYWMLVFDHKKSSVQMLAIATHGGNFLLMFVDFVIGQQPLFFAKILWPIGFVVAYGIFSFVYYRNGGTSESGSKNIYSAMDWSDPRGVATVYGIIFGAIVASWLIFYGAYRVIKGTCGPPPLKG